MRYTHSLKISSIFLIFILLVSYNLKTTNTHKPLSFFDRDPRVTSYQQIPYEWFTTLPKSPDPRKLAKEDSLWERRAMDIYSWNLFIAINSVGDYDRITGRWSNLGSTIIDSSLIPRWGRWLSPSEIKNSTPPFTKKGVTTNANPLLSLYKLNWKAKEKDFTSKLSKNTLILEPNGNFAYQIFNQKNGYSRAISKNDSIKLIDQNGNQVYYEMRVNPVWVSSSSPDSEFAWGESITLNPVVFKDNRNRNKMPSIAIKLAWRKLITGQDKIERYISMNRKGITWGLVGMHIMTKGVFHRDWVWSTFEQVDNTQVNIDDKGNRIKPSFRDPNKDSTPTNTLIMNNQGKALAAQLTRVKEIHYLTKGLNHEVQSWLKKSSSKMQYYQLVGTQYQSYDTVHLKINPLYVRNLVLEPYNVINNQDNKSKLTFLHCMGCHRTAQPKKSTKKIDFSFLRKAGYITSFYSNKHKD